ncbi:alpha/beta hydrolase [Streptomyces sp. p1417]|uniref:Alpha/beta hydrolase n=1 Tax=Streptomyces typhae TaxID=2681492 RepID=A0A6L6WZB2_9ACTN|nr:alpha/beta hydrolase [Streptomyces typhae]MVO86875.1 alpha/beta hydrolase [Streptomyces typhae]
MTRTRIAVRGLAVAAAIAVALAVPLPATAVAQPAPAPAAVTAASTANDTDTPAPRTALPRPTGPFAVGRDTLHLVDKSRKDPWVPTAKARELMLSLYYPAHATGGRPAPYTSTEEARLLLEAFEVDTSAAAVGATRTYARTGAKPVGGRFPLVVLSPGMTAPRSTLTHLAEDLASRGYVVATVDHAYESAGTAFPGGRILTCLACEQNQDPGSGKAIAAVRAKDLSFVLDRLVGRAAVWRHSGLIDARRIGMGGHSIGGAATVAVMNTDQRVRAGMNMDGGIQVMPDGLGKRPFLLLGTERTVQADDPYTWKSAWPRFEGWKRWLTVAGSGHFTFTDVPVLFDQLGVDDPTAPISGPRAEQITRAYIAAYFDRHLRGTEQPLLDGPTAAHPEVGFHQP